MARLHPVRRRGCLAVLYHPWHAHPDSGPHAHPRGGADQVLGCAAGPTAGTARIPVRHSANDPADRRRPILRADTTAGRDHVGAAGAAFAGVRLSASTAMQLTTVAAFTALVALTIQLKRIMHSARWHRPRYDDWSKWVILSVPMLVLSVTEALLTQSDI